MGAAAYWVRHRFVTSWRPLAAIALLAGFMFGGAIAAAAAAARTASAYGRFADESDAWEAMYVNYEGEEGQDSAILSRQQIRELPDVRAVDEVRYEYAAIGPGTAFLADPSGRLGTEVAKAKLLEGRWVDADVANEVVVSFALSDREGLAVGDQVELFPLQYLEQAPPQAQAFVDALLEAAPSGNFDIVGIAAMPGQFPPLVDPGTPLMVVSPAFATLPEASPNSALVIQLEDGADEDAFQRRVEGLAERQGKPPFLGLHRDVAHDIGRSLRPQVVAFIALATVLGLASVVVAAQAISRHVEAEAADHPILRAIGMSPGDLIRAAGTEFAVVGVVAGLIATATAWALSPLSPSGLARIAEPDRGLRLDTGVVAIGALGTAVVVFLLALGLSVLRLRRHTSAFHPALGGVRLPPLVGIGVRRALHQGPPGARAPVWSTIAGAVVGIAALTAALAIGTTLGRQLDDPVRYGLRWDLEVTQYAENSLAEEGPRLLAADHRLSGIATGTSGPTTIGDEEVSLLAMEPVRGEVRPPLVRGIYPDAPDTVAMGSRTLDHFDVDLGDQVALDFRPMGGERRSFRVVGEVVMPPQGFGGRMDEGMLLSLAGIARSNVDTTDANTLFLAGAPGADLGAVVDELVEVVEPDELPSLEHPTTPSDLVDLGRARSMPTLFAAAMAFAGAAGLAHAFFTGSQTRRRETATLRALGFRNQQFYAAALVQGGVLAATTLVLGLALGILGGHTAWRAMAASIGSTLEVHVPVVGMFVVLPLSVFALLVLLAIALAHRDARLRPAPALRTD